MMARRTCEARAAEATRAPLAWRDGLCRRAAGQTDHETMRRSLHA